jgi:Predicted xylanase/chitin deacetylase
MSGPPPRAPADRPWQMTEAEWRGLVNRVRAGRALRPERWPDGARCAFALSFDCDHETFELGAGGRAIGRLAWGEFGRRTGLPRVLDTLARHDVAASFFVPAVAGLIDPPALRPIVDAGHEIGVHGWIHENTSLLDRQTERDLLLRSRDALDRMTGTQPGRAQGRQLGPEPAHRRPGGRSGLCL